MLHANHSQRCPLLGVKRTSHCIIATSAFDPKRTFVRGAQSQGSDDAAFLRASNKKDDGDSAVQSIASDVFAENGPPGPVRQVRKGK